MRSHQHDLRAGLAGFADPTFLLLGKSSSFEWLAEQIEGGRVVVLESESGKDIARLSIVPSTQEGCLSRAGAILKWEVSSIEAALVSQQLRELAASSSPAHVYLDSASNLAGLQILASKGEYDAARIFVG